VNRLFDYDITYYCNLCAELTKTALLQTVFWRFIVGRTLIEDGEARLIFVVSLLELKVALGIALEFY